MVANCPAHGTRGAFGGFQVHQQAWPGIDFNHRAALFVQRARDVFGHHVDAGNVQPHHAGGQRRDVVHFGMHPVGAVDGNVANALDQHAAAGCGNCKGAQALTLQFQHDGVVLVNVNAAEGKVLFYAASGVGVELRVHQVHHAALPIADD